MSYPTFNNYGRAGIPVGTVTGDLLESESDCDLLIYALGTNGAVTTSDMDAIADTLNESSADKIVIDLCMKSNSYDNISKSSVLKCFADRINAKYIRMYDLIPKDSNGNTDSSYFISDGLHPSPLGHRCIAEELAKRLHLSVDSKGLVNCNFTEW